MNRTVHCEVAVPMVALLAFMLASPAPAAPPGDGTPEICDNGIDDDGDRKVDCDDRECRDDPACAGGGGGGSEPRYTIIEVDHCFRERINDNDHWVGSLGLDGAALYRLVDWQPELVMLGMLDPSDPYSEAHDINDSNVVVGESRITGEPDRGFVIIPEGDVFFRDDDADGVNDLMIDLGWATIALGINDTRAVVGRAFDAGASSWRAAAWFPSGPDSYGPAVFLGDAPLGANSFALGAMSVNNNGLAVGVRHGEPAGAVVWDLDFPSAAPYVLPTLSGFPYSNAVTLEINDADEIVGTVYEERGRGGGSRGVLWSPTGDGEWTVSELAPHGRDRGSIAYGLNGPSVATQAVGSSRGRGSGDDSDAVIWENGSPTKLSDLVDGGSFKLIRAHDINEVETIVVTGWNQSCGVLVLTERLP